MSKLRYGKAAYQSRRKVALENLKKHIQTKHSDDGIQMKLHINEMKILETRI
jgi:uncharacterized protein YgfB (UPF0149 family)